MKLIVVSDLHLEHSQRTCGEIFGHEDFSDHVLILAGDICSMNRGMRFDSFSFEMFDHFRAFMHYCSSRFKYVVFVPGNHDLWGTCVNPEKERYTETYCGDHNSFKYRYRNAVDDMKNVHILVHGDHIEVENHWIVGATLWTNLRNSCPLTQLASMRLMVDYEMVRVVDTYGDERSLHSSDWIRMFEKDYDLCLTKIKEADSLGKRVVVVNHHLPSYQSVDPLFASSGLDNYSFCSEGLYLDNTENVDLIIHGHTHCAKDYQLPGAEHIRVLCNPYGYESRQRGKQETGYIANMEIIL